MADIVVTAQRRSERLVDVPISIASVAPAQLVLAGPTSLENLTKVVPGTYIQRSVYGLSPTIRGIGSTLSSSGGEQNVATYVDGVYESAPYGNIFDLASVSDLEVLKGPQGTLFGRNATGGAILIKTLDPGFTTAGKFNVSWERFNQVRASAYLNVPINDKIAINGAIAYRYSEGYIHDERTGALTNEGRNLAARVKLLLQPTDNLSIVLTASHAHLNDPTGVNYQAVTVAAAYLLPGVDSGPIAFDRYHLSHNTRDALKTNDNELNARVKLDLGFATLTSTSAYQRDKLFSVSDLDDTYATIPAPITLPPPLPPIVVGVIPTDQSVTVAVNKRTYQQELNLTSDGSKRLTYVAGIYYFHADEKVPELLSNVDPLFNSEGKSNAIAGYVDATYKFGKLSLIAGARYSRERRFGAFEPGVSAPSPFSVFQRATDEKFTPRTGLRYALSPRSNIYATYSKGFKSGVFDLTAASNAAIKPETLDSYEVGFKTSSRRLTFNAAGYYYNYRNAQVNATVSGQSGQIFTQLFNVPKSEVYGFDIDGTIRLDDSFDVRAALNYTHARYKTFTNAPAYTNDPANPASAFGLIYANISADASGKHMVRAPEFTASGSIGYHSKFGDGNRFDLTVTPYYSSKVYFDFVNSLSQKSYMTLDAGATFTLHDRMTISVFGRNLTDHTYYTFISPSALGTGGTFGMPRNYGVSLGYSF